MAEQLADRQKDALRRRIHRGIAGEKVDVEGFQADPHGMGRVGEAAMCKGVAHQQVAEFVVDTRDRDREPGQQSDSGERNRAEKEKPAKPGPVCNGAQEAPDGSGNSSCRACECDLQSEKYARADQREIESPP
jgi:hypothetical protein